MTYLWLKAFHIISMVAWFAALFYLPRLFVYHAQTTDTLGNERFKVMERKLYRGIATPAMIATLILGVALLSQNPAVMKMGWMHAKLMLVFILIAYHLACGSLMRKFAADGNVRTHRFYRWFNEFPVLILIAVVILVVVKPF
ncbi:protoporphyrinogen oxidase HemJ [Allohahella sp. A8]|uniref:protoporphyrinogen oxidase HemJ n=1 Tax=Allohahella sp. A8 TaxID=3141461 RepID=UPI000C09163D|nr:TIGR00701 family protein [Hahellaceae bacterium]|tara:strand:- start:18162 stop:18587 length:426 start_codon:yes stop_codon:yes gene_type:complete